MDTKDKDKELEDLLEEMGIEPKEVTEPAEEEAVEVEEQPKVVEEVEVEVISREEEALDKAKKKLTGKISSLYTTPASREKFETRMKTYDSAVEWGRNNGEIEAVEKIVPDIEKVLFPHYVGGSSVRAIWQQFGKQFGFSLNTLYKAKEFYLWEERKKAIAKGVMTEQGVEMVTRMSDYMTFFDDLMGEAMIRFKKNSDSGQNASPFNQLKVQNIRDLKDLTELMMNISGMKSAVGKDGKPIPPGSSSGGGSAPRLEGKMSDKKAARILAILAEAESDDDEDEDE